MPNVRIAGVAARPSPDRLVKSSQPPIVHYTIMPDYGGYGWMNERGDDVLGGNCADSSGWFGLHKISRYLEKRLGWWASDFEHAGNEMFKKGRQEMRLDWGRFHRRGIELAWELKGELGNRARVFYEKPVEDPGYKHLERREIMDDGLYREAEIVTRPGPKHCHIGL